MTTGTPGGVGLTGVFGGGGERSGTSKASTVDTTMAPMTIRFVRVPASDRMTKAIRRSSLVTVMAAARNKAAATSVRAVLPNPLTAVARP